MFSRYQKFKTLHAGLLAAAVLAVGTLGALSFYQRQESDALNARISVLENETKILAASLQQANVLSKNSAAQIREIASRQAVAAQSQSERLTAAVAKVSPAVVSIVISKAVPQLKVSYVNPFGEDPLFRGFGIQIPVYQQVGTTTQKVGAGTGLIIRSDGYIVTNRHVASDLNAQYTALLSTGAQKPARVVYQDRDNDIAILKIDGTSYPAAPLGDSSRLALGETVAAIGNALGEYNNSVSVGVVSGINRTIEAADETGNVEKLTGILQTDAAINPGNSGGPLLDLDGNVVGINVATVIGSNSISFSIPVNQVKQIIAREI